MKKKIGMGALGALAAVALMVTLGAGDFTSDWFFGDQSNKTLSLSSDAKVKFSSTASGDPGAGGALAAAYDVGLARGGVAFLKVTDGASSTGKLIAASVGPDSTHQLTLPSITTDTLATLAGTETLSNKTIASPIITTGFTFGGLAQRPDGIFFAQVTPTAAIASSNTRTVMIGAGTGTLTLPANFLTVGKTIKIHLGGLYTAKATPGAITVDFAVATSAVATSGSVLAFDTTAETAQPWVADIYVTCVTTGASGTAYAHGRAEFETAVFHPDSIGISAASTFVIDTTATKALQVYWTWATSDPGNSVTTQVATAEALN